MNIETEYIDHLNACAVTHGVEVVENNGVYSIFFNGRNIGMVAGPLFYYGFHHENGDYRRGFCYNMFRDNNKIAEHLEIAKTTNEDKSNFFWPTKLFSDM